MENASKALLMAGAVLISILVLTLGVYFAKRIAEYSANTYKRLEEHKKSEYNQQFLNYDNYENPERELLTIQDIATLINLAKNSNWLNGAENPPTDINNTSSLYVKVDLSEVLEFNDLSIDINNYNGKKYEYDKAEQFPEELVNDLINKWMKEKVDKGYIGTFRCHVSINTNNGYVNYIQISK